jgi:hypothetical protein
MSLVSMARKTPSKENEKVNYLIFNYYLEYPPPRWAGGSVVGEGTTLHARRYWVQVQIRSFDFSVHLILPVTL